MRITQHPRRSHIANLSFSRTSSCLCNLWNSSVRRKLVKYLAKSRDINKGEVQSEEDGRISYQADEFEGALFYITTSVIQDRNASDKSLACDDDDSLRDVPSSSQANDDSLAKGKLKRKVSDSLRDIPSLSQANDYSLAKWNLKPKVGTAVIQLLRMRQGSPSSGQSED
jgi:hypothetical protein